MQLYEAGCFDLDDDIGMRWASCQESASSGHSHNLQDVAVAHIFTERQRAILPWM